MQDFAAIDFETANNERSSVCSVGVVIVRGGDIVDKFYSLIKPEPVGAIVSMYDLKPLIVDGMFSCTQCSSYALAADIIVSRQLDANDESSIDFNLSYSPSSIIRLSTIAATDCCLRRGLRAKALAMVSTSVR